MPLGTIDFTQAKIPYDTAGTHRRAIGNYSGPKSYVTGGDPVAPGDFKLFGVLEQVDFSPALNAAGTALKTYVYNATKQTVQSFDANATETAGGTDLSGFTATFEAIGE